MGEGDSPGHSKRSLMKYAPIDVSRLRTTQLADRTSKVSVDRAGRSAAAGVTFADWFDRLPGILAASDLRQLAERTARALKHRRPVLLGMGGHVIKTGLGPLVCDLLREDLVTAVVANGSVTIHDVELALVGRTSEDVDAALQTGEFGMSAETAEFCLDAIARGRDAGIGSAVGTALLAAGPANVRSSVLATCAELDKSMCVTVAIGTDIIHGHPRADGAALGAASMVDFRTLCSIVADLLDGGVYLNFGSAVLLPEVFLKAVSIARNLGHRGDFTTADFDFVRQYRPATNVVRRPHLGTNGRGFAFTGHHELMFPLFWQAVRMQMAA